MANESIRLPSDSTVASQKVHRGTQAPETQAPPPTTKASAHPLPLATVVLESKPLIEGQKGALFELILQNDPKSDPTIRLTSDSPIQPGTSLLLTVDEDNQYQVIEKPTPAQLKRLIQLELEFWRAHLIPKAGHRVFPDLPPAQALQKLVSLEPQLMPLVKWLTYRAPSVDTLQVQRWIREFTPLSTTKQWQPLTENLSLTLARPAAEPKTTATLDSVVARPTTTMAANPNTLQPAFPDIRLNRPVGLIEAPMLSRSTFNLLSAALNTPLTNTTKPLSFSGQVFQLSTSQPQIPARLLHEQFLPLRFTLNPQISAANAAQSVPASHGQSPVTAPETSSLSQPARTLPILTIETGQDLTRVGQAMGTNLPGTSTPTDNSSQTPGTPTPASPLSNGDASKQAPQPPLNPVSEALKAILPPPPDNAGRVPAEPTMATPLEARLAQWITTIDTMIAQSPAHLHAQLKDKARDLLNQVSGQTSPFSMGHPDPAHKKPANEDESTLLSLRSWLDATLARLQHNAVQTTAHQWAQPETPVQQMQLPLIWLGLTHWADIEWWPEKTERKKSDDKKEKQRRQWRLKVYLTLSPLAPVCADIQWSDSTTNVTFWSEDRATLGHLNNLLPNLQSWTEGLGERQLTTKHGMPKRATEATAETQGQHLVDIRT